LDKELYIFLIEVIPKSYFLISKHLMSRESTNSLSFFFQSKVKKLREGEKQMPLSQNIEK